MSASHVQNYLKHCNNCNCNCKWGVLVLNISKSLQRHALYAHIEWRCILRVATEKPWFSVLFLWNWLQLGIFQCFQPRCRRKLSVRLRQVDVIFAFSLKDRPTSFNPDPLQRHLLDSLTWNFVLFARTKFPTFNRPQGEQVISWGSQSWFLKQN